MRIRWCSKTWRSHQDRCEFPRSNLSTFRAVSAPTGVDLPESPSTCGPPLPQGGAGSNPVVRDEVDKTQIVEKPSSVKQTKAG